MMRQIPLGGASLLGLYASYYRGAPLIYILFTFVCVPGMFMGVSAAFDASVAGGVILLLIIVSTLGAFEYWWICRGGCYKVLPEEARKRGKEELATAIRGMQEEPAEGTGGAEVGA